MFFWAPAKITPNFDTSMGRDRIVELRSATAGVGTFEAAFDHLQEITGPVAQKVVDKRKSELAAA